MLPWLLDVWRGFECLNRSRAWRAVSRFTKEGQIYFVDFPCPIAFADQLAYFREFYPWLCSDRLSEEVRLLTVLDQEFLAIFKEKERGRV